MLHSKGLTFCIGSPTKRIRYKNAFRLVIVILLITLISSNPNSSLTKYKQPSNNFDSFDMAEISDLPNASITINILGTMFGNQIEAKLDYGFRYDNTSSLIYGIGFSQQYLTIENSIIFTQASGLGYDEMREYPFAYTDSGMITDYWLNHTANWISRRKYAAWTSLAAYGGYLGPISEENITHLTKVGDIIEFENLTIYFEDGTSFLCGPRVITVGVNFTQQNGEWEVEYLIDSSDSQHTLIQESEMTIYLSKSDPISTPFIGGVSVAFVIVIILSLEWYRRRLPKSLSSTSRIELS
ncbi:MAG: hypothetical protein E4H14_16635 [Candidatus Thorarchaeota archaeon]|nr:MAG: hypothetical protein E4H14_16635 [Candidatus Thorarchaeota archaeon]